MEDNLKSSNFTEPTDEEIDQLRGLSDFMVNYCEKYQISNLKIIAFLCQALESCFKNSGLPPKVIHEVLNRLREDSIAKK
jgi:hypothetical protein